jgi:pilus assembly protein Flp/PilA
LENDLMRKLIKKLAANRSGATAIEYGLLAGLIAVVIIAGVTLVGGNLSTTFNNVAGAIPPAAAPAA